MSGARAVFPTRWICFLPGRQLACLEIASSCHSCRGSVTRHLVGRHQDTTINTYPSKHRTVSQPHSPPPPKNNLVQDINKAEKAWVRGKGDENYTVLLHGLLQLLGWRVESPPFATPPPPPLPSSSLPSSSSPPNPPLQTRGGRFLSMPRSFTYPPMQP